MTSLISSLDNKIHFFITFAVYSGLKSTACISDCSSHAAEECEVVEIKRSYLIELNSLPLRSLTQPQKEEGRSAGKDNVF